MIRQHMTNEFWSTGSAAPSLGSKIQTMQQSAQNIYYFVNVFQYSYFLFLIPAWTNKWKANKHPPQTPDETVAPSHDTFPYCNT